MRQRVVPEKAASAAKLRSSLLSGQPPLMRTPTQKRQLRAFLVATVCFLICVVLYLYGGVSPSPSSSLFSTLRNSQARLGATSSRPMERDVLALGLIADQVEAFATLPAFKELSKIAAQIGAVYLPLLEQIAAAEEKEDGGQALRQLDVSQHHLTSVAVALDHAADVCYGKLKRMLLQEPNAELAMAPTSVVRAMYGWMLTDVFLYGAVLPEYYLLRDDTASHARVLLRTISLLSWTPLVHTGTIPSAAEADVDTLTHRPSVATSLTNYNIFNWSDGAACRRGPLGVVSSKWLQFCETSFSSWLAVARRTAATWEELIALYPTYAPLRLHYAVSFAFLPQQWASDGIVPPVTPPPTLTEHAMKVLRMIRNDREKLSATAYQHADAVHVSVLALLEAFLTPVDMWTSEQHTALMAALNVFESCKQMHAALVKASSWAGNTLPRGEYRPPLLSHAQLSSVLVKVRVLLGADDPAYAPFKDCL